MKESMEAIITHFKQYSEGLSIPEGGAYVGIEAPKGELGVFIVADGNVSRFALHIIFFLIEFFISAVLPLKHSYLNIVISYTSI
jgi:NADH:ubiquinone oxidoreductase subunit D